MFLWNPRKIWLSLFVLLALCSAVVTLEPTGVKAADADSRARALTASARPEPVVAATHWLDGQLSTGTTVTSPSTIAPEREYAADWTGAVSGTFSLSGIPVPPIDDAPPIVIDSPSVLPGSYRAGVNGHVTLAPQPGRWIVQVLWSSGGQTSQVPLQALVAGDGTFQLDLADAPQMSNGSWGFEILDADNSYVPTGSAWPGGGNYAGLQVDAFVTTDVRYLIGATAAPADGRFDFADSRPGVKSFQLVESATGTVLAEWAPRTGLIRSFDVPSSDPRYGVCYTYDQSLALLAAMSVGQAATARTLAVGLLALQTSGGAQDGGFVSSAAALAPAYAVPEYRTGIDAIATYALLRYLAWLPADDPTRASVRASAGRAVNWLEDQQVHSGDLAGLLTGGHGDYTAEGTFDPGIAITWASTEHNLDAWHTFTLAASVLSDATARAAAGRLSAAIVSRLWDGAAARFIQGWTVSGPDDADPLDANSWGAIFLIQSGRPALAGQALVHVEQFAAVDAGISGYAPVTGQAEPIVWFEGSAGVALAQLRNGDSVGSRAILSSLAAGQQASGALPYATRDDADLDMSDAPAVASTAWFVLASQASTTGSIWDEEGTS